MLSGSGTALVMRVGAATEFGRISSRLRERPTATGFERGMTAFGYLLSRVMLVLVAAIFVINAVLGRPLLDVAFVSLALAVGLTPQLLPAIVTISLSSRRPGHGRAAGDREAAGRDRGLRRHDRAVHGQDRHYGDVGSVVLEGALDVDGKPSAQVSARPR